MRKELLIAVGVMSMASIGAGTVQAEIVKQWDSGQQRWYVYDSETMQLLNDPHAPESSNRLRMPDVGGSAQPQIASRASSATAVQQAYGRPPIGTASPIPREFISYNGPYGPNTIVISTSERRLYWIYETGKAIRYGVGVGREGFQWSGAAAISRKAEWPGWTPPPQMIAREAAKGHILPAYMPGGLNNPLGARALYIGASLYRIHGSNEPWTIGHAVSSGCIRMTNEDVTDLYDRVGVGAKVVVLP